MSQRNQAVRDALAGVGSLGGGLPSDNAPLDAVFRAYQAEGEPISRGVAACLVDEDPSIRGQAVLFFERFPEAPGGEALLSVWASHPELYLDVDNPWMSGYPLAWQLLRSIGARVMQRDAAALALAKREVLVKGRAQPLIAALADREPRWVVAHAEAIVRESPEAGAALLANLRGVDVGALGEKLAPLAARDPKFRGYIEMFISDEAIKQRILSAIK